MNASSARIYFIACASLRASFVRWRNRRFALGSAAASASPSSSRARVFSVLRSRAASEGARVLFASILPSNLFRSNTTQCFERRFLRPSTSQAFQVAPHLWIPGDLRNPQAIGRFGEAFLGVASRLLRLARLHAKPTAEATPSFLPDALPRNEPRQAIACSRITPARSYEYFAERLNQGPWNVRLGENRNGGEPLREHDAAVSGEKDEGDVADHCELAQAQSRV